MKKFPWCKFWRHFFPAFGARSQGQPQTGRIRRLHRAPSEARVERLEDRSLLSPFYDVTEVASTADGFVGFGDLVSINNAGTIAFVGYRNDYDKVGDPFPDELRESGLWIAEAGNSPLNVNPEFSNTNGRDFGRLVAINDDGVLSARDRSLDFSFDLRTWDPTELDSFTLLETTDPEKIVFTVGGRISFSKYSSLLTFTDINNNGDVAFVGTTPDSEFRTIELHLNGDDQGISTRLDTFPRSPIGGPTPRIQLTEDRQVLTRLDNNTIMLFDAAGNRKIFASAADGFTSTGAAPGITADGRVVVFTGDRGRGAGIFASYYSDGVRHIVRVAGEGFDGWTDFDLNSAVRVTGRIGDAVNGDRGVTVAFEGTHNSLGHGIFTSRVSFYGLSGANYYSNNISDVRVSGAAPVALVGESVTPGGPAITELEPYGMNDQGRGELAFWVKMGNNEAVVRALPHQVLFVDFVPGLYNLSGYTEANLGLLSELGLQSGWGGTFVDAMTQLGYSGNPFQLQGQIRNEVQALFDATGARVRVVNTPPAFVPRTATNEAGQVLTTNGIPIRNGAFQTVQVGAAPNLHGDIGLSSPVYTRAGGLDFFNQVIDDTAVVFANRLFNSAAFTVPFSSLTDTVRIQAVADVIAHEAGHNFGLVHTRRDYDDDIMHRGTNPGEYEITQDFSEEQTEIDPSMGIPGATENPAARLVFSTGGSFGNPGDPPTLQLLRSHAQYSLYQRYKLSGSLTSSLTTSSIAVAHLLIGTVDGQSGDLLPVFQDVGSGDLAGLIAGAPLQAPANGRVTLVGSSDGLVADIIGIPVSQAGAETSLSLSVMGIASDERLYGGVGEPFNLFHLPPGGSPSLIGTFTIAGIPEAVIFAGEGQLSSGSTLGLGETTPGGGTISKLLTIRNTGAGQLAVGEVTITGPGYAVSQPSQTTLAPGEETTVNVTLLDTTAGIGITGTLTIPSDDPNSPFTLTLRGTVDDRPRVLGVTRLDNGTGPLRVSIDFSGTLRAGPAGDRVNFAIVRDGGLAVPVASAVYSETSGHGRVTLTAEVGSDDLDSGIYSVRFDGTKVVSATGAPLATSRNTLLVGIRSDQTLATIGTGVGGELGVLHGPDRTGFGPPQQLAVVDLNGDGLPDIVTVSSNTGELLLLEGDAEGGFGSPIPIAMPDTGDVNKISSPVQVRVADWDSDGTSDLIVLDNVHPPDSVGEFWPRIVVLVNDGDANFITAPDTPIPLARKIDVYGNIYPYDPAAFAVGDFTGDGLLDIALEKSSSSYFNPSDQAPLQIIGKDQFLGYSVQTILTNGRNGDNVATIVTGDFNEDGRLDLMTNNSGFFLDRPGASLYLSNASGGFAAAQDIRFGIGESSETGGLVDLGGGGRAGDFNGDGHLDLIGVVDLYSNSEVIHEGSVVVFMAGDGHGGFTRRPYLKLNRRGVSIADIGDLNSDGKLDLLLFADQFDVGLHGLDVTLEKSLWTLLGDGQGGFVPLGTPSSISAAGVTAPGNFVLSDLTDDGLPDVLYSNLQFGQIGLATNDGGGRIRATAPAGPHVPLKNGFANRFAYSEAGIVVADLNRDGFADQIRLNHDDTFYYFGAGEYRIDLLLGSEGGTFHVATSIGWDPNVQSPGGQVRGSVDWLRVGDLNQDGWLDIVMGSSGNDAIGGAAVAVLLGIDGTTFAPAVLIDAGSSGGTSNGTLADVNSDGNLDLVANLNQGRGFGVYFGNGTGKLTFNINSVFQVTDGIPGGAMSPFVADVTGDGKLDIVTITATQNLIVYAGQGNGRFQQSSTIHLGGEFEVWSFKQLLPGDFNGDGKLDILLVASDDSSNPFINSGALHFALGNGTGQFTYDHALTINIGKSIANVVAVDLTGDGLTDLALTNGYWADSTGLVTVLAGDGTGSFGPIQLIDVGGLLPWSLAVLPVAGTIDAGTFSISHVPFSAPAGALDLAATTTHNQPTVVDPRPTLAALTNVGLVLAVILQPEHGTVNVNANGTPTDLTDDVLVYTPDPGFVGEDVFTYIAADEQGGNATGMVSIFVAQPGSLPPTLTATAGLTSYVEDSQPVVVDPDITVADPDSPNFNGGNLTISIATGGIAFHRLAIQPQFGGDGAISLNGTTVLFGGNVIGTWAGGTNGSTPLTITFTSDFATPAAVQLLARSVVYSNVGNIPASANRLIQFTLSDGDGGIGPAAAKTMTDVPVNGDPELTTSAGTTSYAANAAPVIIDSGVAISDPDSSNFSGGYLSIQLIDGADFLDRLAVRDQGNNAGQIGIIGSSVLFGGTVFGHWEGGINGSTPLFINFTSTLATPAVVQALARNIIFSNNDTSLALGERLVEFFLDDGDNGQTFAGKSIIVEGSSSNHEPTLQNAIPNQFAVVGTAFTFTVPSNTFSDIDVGDLLQHAATNMPEWLTFDPDSRTFSGTPSVNDITSGGPLTLIVTATDQSFASVSATFQLSIVPTGGATHISVGGPEITWIKKQPAAKVLPSATVSGSSLGGGTLTLTMNVVSTAKKRLDQVYIPVFTGLGVSLGPQFANGHLTLQIQLNTGATDTAIQSFLRAMTFATKGKGLKTATRNVQVTLTNSIGASSTVNQTINVRKK